MEKRHVPPSRKRYEAKFPLITIRVPKDVKNMFLQIHSKAGISARQLFVVLLNSYMQITTQPKQVERPAPKPRETLYKLVDGPTHLHGIIDPPEGWKGPLPDEGAITADRNKIEMLERANYKFEEVKETF